MKFKIGDHIKCDCGMGCLTKGIIIRAQHDIYIAKNYNGFRVFIFAKYAVELTQEEMMNYL